MNIVRSFRKTKPICRWARQPTSCRKRKRNTVRVFNTSSWLLILTNLCLRRRRSGLVNGPSTRWEKQLPSDIPSGTFVPFSPFPVCHTYREINYTAVDRQISSEIVRQIGESCNARYKIGISHALFSYCWQNTLEHLRNPPISIDRLKLQRFLQSWVSSKISSPRRARILDVKREENFVTR